MPDPDRVVDGTQSGGDFDGPSAKGRVDRFVGDDGKERGGEAGVNHLRNEKYLVKIERNIKFFKFI